MWASGTVQELDHRRGALVALQLRLPPGLGLFLGVDQREGGREDCRRGPVVRGGQHRQDRRAEGDRAVRGGRDAGRPHRVEHRYAVAGEAGPDAQDEKYYDDSATFHEAGGGMASSPTQPNLGGLGGFDIKGLGRSGREGQRRRGRGRGNRHPSRQRRRRLGIRRPRHGHAKPCSAAAAAPANRSGPGDPLVRADVTYPPSTTADGIGLAIMGARHQSIPGLLLGWSAQHDLCSLGAGDQGQRGRLLSS